MPTYNLVAGTTWLFASKALRDSPVDVLIIDEAGQLGLADALAASCAAGSVVLLGDPLQLPQVSQAIAPRNGRGSACSSTSSARTSPRCPADRGVFLDRDPADAPATCARSSPTRSTRAASASHESCAVQTHRPRHRPAVAAGRSRRLFDRVGGRGRPGGRRDAPADRLELDRLRQAPSALLGGATSWSSPPTTTRSA